MIQCKGDNLKEVINFTGKDKNFDKWFKSFEEYEKYVHEHNDIFKLFNEDGSHYEVPVGAWIVKTPDGYNVASKAVLKQKPDESPKDYHSIDPHFGISVEDLMTKKNTADNNVEPKFKVKYAGNEYNVLEVKDIAGVTFYGIEDEPKHIDYVKAENCEMISGLYAIKENGSPYPTNPAEWSEEDETILNQVITNYESGYLPSVVERDEIVKKLKSLKTKFSHN